MLAFKGTGERTAPSQEFLWALGWGWGIDRNGQEANRRLGSQWPACEDPRARGAMNFFPWGPAPRTLGAGISYPMWVSCGSCPSYGPVPGGGGHPLSTVHAALMWLITEHSPPRPQERHFSHVVLGPTLSPGTYAVPALTGCCPSVSSLDTLSHLSVCLSVHPSKTPWFYQALGLSWDCWKLIVCFSEFFFFHLKICNSVKST